MIIKINYEETRTENQLTLLLLFLRSLNPDGHILQNLLYETQ